MRGTIGGNPGNALTPIDLVEFVSAFATLLQNKTTSPKVVIGRDGRTSGHSIQGLVINVLRLCGCDVVNLDLSTTPSVEMAVVHHKADGGIILTASHNPAQWNALKFLNDKGEFISAEIGSQLLHLIETRQYFFSEHEAIGSVQLDDQAINRHIEAILALDYVETEKIRQKKFHIVIDAINSTGAIAIPPLLEHLNASFTIINKEVNGKFSHNPEPLPKHLNALQKAVIDENADLGIAVDPDVDRLAFFGPSGHYFGEEYTLVACADLVLSKRKGATVSNLSSTKALTDLSQSYHCQHLQSAVGEVNVVNLMKESKAVIGGEGNGGVILPELHYGRDALVGIALVLSLLAERNVDLNQLRKSYTHYEMMKDKIQLEDGLNPDHLVQKVHDKFISSNEVSTVDGVKVFFENGWVHLRKSNTEPIVRVYSEGRTKEEAEQYVRQVKNVISGQK